MVIKQLRRYRRRKSHLKSKLKFFQSLLFSFSPFGKCWRNFLVSNSKGLYPNSEKKSLCCDSNSTFSWNKKLWCSCKAFQTLLCWFSRSRCCRRYRRCSSFLLCYSRVLPYGFVTTKDSDKDWSIYCLVSFMDSIPVFQQYYHSSKLSCTVYVLYAGGRPISSQSSI